VTDFADLPSDDQQAIGKTLLTLLTSFRDRDAEALRAVYSNDADWVDAFGTVKRGREEIVDY
jgi:ketosteroid isomerase-like protein